MSLSRCTLVESDHCDDLERGILARESKWKEETEELYIDWAVNEKWDPDPIWVARAVCDHYDPD